jgi:hypothetical protein
MRTSLSFTVKGFLILLLILALQALPGAAQTGQDEVRPGATGDANRDRVLSALIQDPAAADKVLSELLSNPSGKATAAAPFSVAFEEIKACGFYPQETRLECILDIKRPSGYGGGAPGLATHEFVTFCVDWNCNGSFSADEEVGFGMVHMHDESPPSPNPPSQPVWQYAVYRDIDPPGSLSPKCQMRTGPGGANVLTTTGPRTIQARAILSWFSPVRSNNPSVTTCNALPVWGNVINFRIRLDPIR